MISMQRRGLIPNKEASVAKLYTSELDQRMVATGMRLLGLGGATVAALLTTTVLARGREPRTVRAA